jgi:hypothetical protein
MLGCMSERVEVKAHGPHSYAVAVTEGDNTTRHVVEVPESMWELDEERCVRETFAFLLEREPATSIMPEFSLLTVSRYFPEYADELRARLSA